MHDFFRLVAAWDLGLARVFCVDLREEGSPEDAIAPLSGFFVMSPLDDRHACYSHFAPIQWSYGSGHVGGSRLSHLAFGCNPAVFAGVKLKVRQT